MILTLTETDNPINQNILSMFFRKKKIRHQTAKDGQEAVEKWRTGGFHLILVRNSCKTLLLTHRWISSCP
jgi:osomolarity two-component system response regulator SSK1